MRRLMKRLGVALAGVSLVFTLGTGVAFAHPEGAVDGGVQTAWDAGAGAPVGSNISDEGFANISGTAVAAIVDQNPFFPATL